jgi:sporulation integral membrane protein YtvI
MRFFPEEGYKRVLVLFLYGAIGSVLLYGILRYLFPALLPFLIAFPAAVLLRRPTLKISRHTKIPRKVIAALLAILFVSLLLCGIGFLIWKLVNEIGDFTRAVLGGENALLENLEIILSRIGDFSARLPFSGGEDGEALRGAVTETVLGMAKNAVSSLGTKLPEMAGKLASAVPQALIFFVVTVLSAVYFCADYDRITAFFHRYLRGKAWDMTEKLRAAAGTTLKKVFRSYAILFLFTFSELLLGFVLLGEAYAFLLALITALVDSLPVFGTGSVLLPLALYRFFTGDSRTATGFLILYAAVTVIRQILEPKILGEGVGMHPLLMLISMYAGLKLFGIFGMILIPILAMIAKNIIPLFRAPEKENSHGAS